MSEFIMHRNMCKEELDLMKVSTPLHDMFTGQRKSVPLAGHAQIML